MDRICIGIKYTMHPETNEYTWDFAGGCYEDLGDALNKEKDGVNLFLDVLDNMKSFTHVEFGWEDIVRSDFVRDYIMTKEWMGIR